MRCPEPEHSRYINIPLYPSDSAGFHDFFLDCPLVVAGNQGETKVDILLHDTNLPEQAIHRIAKSEGVQLY
ncbi:hypothetical protein [Candidatus Sororendozoicomonas aggregata]|uniref:hypothetical protein n=1 Tax=Candidatus Sororendozoicomonas aggregata TaxID=3073239 RepID=UPI002ED000D2